MKKNATKIKKDESVEILEDNTTSKRERKPFRKNFHKKFRKPFSVECELVKVTNENGEEVLDEKLLPESKTFGSGGYDLKAYSCDVDTVTGETIEAVEGDPENNNPVIAVLKPGKSLLIHTGVKIKIPPFHIGWVTPRSGLAFKYGISCVNTPGEIDWDYRGDVGVILINHGEKKFVIRKYDRIAQITFIPVKKGKMLPVEKLSEDVQNERGEGGYGSTGVNDVAVKTE